MEVKLEELSLVRDRIAKANHQARAIQGILGDKCCPDAGEGGDMIDTIISDLDVLLQRLDSIGDVVRKL